MAKNPTDYRTALKRGKFEDVEDKDIEYDFVSPNQLFSYSMNIMPLLNAVPSQRAFYGDRFSLQAVPVDNGEAPWVQSKDMESGDSFDAIVGRKVGSVFSDDDDDKITITDVTPDSISYTNSKGQKKVKDLYNNFAYNRKTLISSIPLVKKGDVLEGTKRILAKSNYTDDTGSLAMGKNAVVAVVPFKGYSLDDAIVVSEDFAKRMSSTQMYKYGQDTEEGIKIGKQHHHALFPDAFTKQQLENIDDNGVVKVGSVIHKGDPIILSSRPKMMSAKDQQLGRLSKYLKNTRNDASQVWEHEDDGVVTDVIKTRHGYKVNIKSSAPLKMGDKITIRNGQKVTLANIIPQENMPRIKVGTDENGEPIYQAVDALFNPLGVPCYDTETEILTDQGWIPVSKCDLTYNYMTLNPDTLVMEFQKATDVHHYDYNGKMYHITNRQLDIMVTPNHRQFTIKRGPRLSTKSINFSNPKVKQLFAFEETKDIVGLPRKYLKAARWECNKYSEEDIIHIPQGSYTNTNRVGGIPASGFDVPLKVWVEFMGWFLSEGSTSADGKNHNVSIAQSYAKNPEKYEKIKSLLKNMMGDINIHEKKDKSEFIISHKGLWETLKKYGKCDEKYIPRYILDLPENLAKIFLSAMLDGDGNIYNNSKTGHLNVATYSSTSKKLMDGLQEMFAKLGRVFNIKQEHRTKCNSRIKTRRPCYYASIQKGDAGAWVNFSEKQKSRQTEEWIDYTGKVHCVTVPNGIVFVRRNNKAVFSGNSRVNASSMMEILLGKVAAKTGKPYILPGFNKANENWYDFVQSEMDKHGVQEQEDLYDPTMLDENGNMKKLDNPVTVGNAYFYKLHHMGESKLSYRGQGIYTGEDQPAKGGDEGMRAKRMSGLMINGLLSAGAYNYIKDGIHLRGQRNDDYWRAVRMGETPSLLKKSPFVWDKYLATMQGAGINAVSKGKGILQASPFTDRQFDALNPVELKNAEIVDIKNLKPVEGGLFDPTMSLSKRWGKITLDRPYPNPGFENAIVSLLGIKKSDMMEIMKGEKALDGYGKGNEALYKALEDIDMDKMLEDAKDQFKNGPKSKKPQALNRITYITGLKKNGLTPNELMITKVPVLPAQFRPYSIMGDTFLPGDANELYKDVFLMNETQKEVRDELGDEEAARNTENMYNSIKALYGFGEPMSQKLKQRGVSGFMNKLVGGTSKFSQMNRSVNSKPTDFTGRAVIDPDVELGMDEVGLPEEMAWTLFGPYISGKLVKGGMSPKDALENIENQTEAARKALDAVLKERPITVSRDPQWHKYNTVGGWVKLHKGKNILINPIINSGISGDFDGDTMTVHVPGTAGAVKDVVEKLMPSRQVLSIRDNKNVVNTLKQDYLLPLYLASTAKPSEQTYVFNTKQEALNALKSGRIKYTDDIIVREMQQQ